MEGEYASTIIQSSLSTDLAVIQLKDSHLILHISQQKHRRCEHFGCQANYPYGKFSDISVYLQSLKL